MSPDTFLQLSDDDRREALEFAASQLGRPANLLEKDVWVVKSLDILFSSSFGPHLVFKGGTALSKVHQVIDRFSEDVDITYDIRSLVPDAKGLTQGIDVTPANPSQEKKLTNTIRKERLPAWLQNEIHPLFLEALSNFPVRLELTCSPGLPALDTLEIAYPAVTSTSEYAQPVIKLEFGGRSTGEPAHESYVVCDMASQFDDLVFPTATPRAMDISRIFWEKATAIHVHCLQHKPVAGRFSRHFHDIAQLNMKGHASKSIATREVALSVALHKALWFSAKDEKNVTIDYARAVNGELILVPEGEALENLRRDYEAMGTEGLLLSDEALTFDSVIEHCRQLQDEANRVGKVTTSKPS